MRFREYVSEQWDGADAEPQPGDGSWSMRMDDARGNYPTYHAANLFCWVAIEKKARPQSSRGCAIHDEST
jgi:hypothetical protein